MNFEYPCILMCKYVSFAKLFFPMMGDKDLDTQPKVQIQGSSLMR